MTRVVNQLEADRRSDRKRRLIAVLWAPAFSTAAFVVLVLAFAPRAAAFVYWANDSGTTIGRANLDGTGTNQSFIAGASNPCGTRGRWSAPLLGQRCRQRDDRTRQPHRQGRESESPSLARGQEIVDSHANCRDEGVELGVHEASLVDVAFSNAPFGALAMSPRGISPPEYGINHLVAAEARIY